MRIIHRSFAHEMVGLALVCALASACGERGDSAGADSPMTVRIDGSSTVFPITEALAEEFMAETRGAVRVTVATSGTGGGFRRFCTGDIAIADASRPITESEREQCGGAGIEPIELPVAYDGLSVVTNPANEFVECLTVDELRRIWEPGSTVQTWSDIRPEWPDTEIHLYGPGTNSGTFDYFTEAIVGEQDASRADYTASEDDNMLVQGVAGDPDGLGYFGYAYYEESRGRLKLVSVDGGSGCVQPTPETIESGTYAPLSRPLFIYVSAAALERPEVQQFLRFYMENAAQLVPDVGYIPLEPERYRQNLQMIERRTGGAT